MAYGEQRRRFRPGLYYSLGARDWFGRRWRGPMYLRAGRWRHDLMAVLGQVEAIVRTGGSLADGLEASAFEERRRLNRPSYRTAAQAIQIGITLLVVVAIALFVLVARTEAGYRLYYTVKHDIFERHGVGAGYVAIDGFESPPPDPEATPFWNDVVTLASVFRIKSVCFLLAVAAFLGIPGLLILLQIRYHSGALEAVLLRLRDRIARGVPLSEAMAGMRRFFPAHYADLVYAGETSGNLADTLRGLNKETLDGVQRHAGIQHHLVYFMVVVTLQIGMFSFVGSRVIHAMEEGNRPLYVRTLLDPDNPAGGPPRGEVIEAVFDTPRWGGAVFARLKSAMAAGYPFTFRGYLTVAAGIAILALFLARRRKRSAASRALVGTSLLLLPGLRRYSIVRNVTLSARLLCRLIGAGMPVPDALRRVASADLGRAYRRAFSVAAKRVEQGNTLAAAFDGFPRLFPPGFRTLTRVGERSGMLSSAMDQAAERYGRELDRLTAALYDSVMPIGVILLGALSLGLVAAVYQYHVAYIEVMMKLVD